MCLLCQREDETVSHFLLHCPALDSIRNPIIDNIISVCSGVYSPTKSPDSFVQLLLDCSALTCCNVGLLANKPRQWKSMLNHQGWFICLYIQHLLVPQTTEFVICISIYIRHRAVTLLPPPRSLDPRLGLGNTWVRQLRSGS